MGETLDLYCLGGVGLCAVAVCSSLTRERVEARVNQESPTGIESRWEIAVRDFADGTANGVACPDHPETHRHWLLEC